MSTTPVSPDAGLSAGEPTGVQRVRPATVVPVAAVAATVLLLVDGLIMVTAGDAVGDHASGAGLWSEAVAGAAFVAFAAALLPLAPTQGLRRVLWLLAPAGLLVAGLTMLGVVLTGTEPAEWLFAIAVLPTLVGLVSAGVVGARSGTWPWWTGLGVALFLPIMFLVPFNSFVMAATTAAVALTARRTPPSPMC
jgi:hypothetical protein